MACFITAIICQDMCRHLITHPHFVFSAFHLALFPAEASATGFLDGALSGAPSERWDILDKEWEEVSLQGSPGFGLYSC